MPSGRKPQKEREETVCPHCGQRMMMRFGVRLTPKKADIFDMLLSRSRAGGYLECDTLGWTFFPGQSKKRAGQTVRSHMSQLRDLFVSTDIKITYGHSGYRITGYRDKSNGKAV